MADRTSAPKGALITGVVFILLAFGGCGYGCASFVGFANELVDAADGRNSVPVGTPTTFRATDSGAVILTTGSQVTCAVDGPGEIDLQSAPTGTEGTFELNGRTFEFSYYFDTESGSEYRIQCGDGLDDGGAEYVVAAFPIDRILIGFAGVGLGALFLVIGVILVIVGLVRRSKWKKQGAPGGGYGPPSAGGYGPPPSAGYGPPPSGGYGPPPSGPSAPPPGMPPPPAGPPPGGPPPGPPPMGPPPTGGPPPAPGQ